MAKTNYLANVFGVASKRATLLNQPLAGRESEMVKNHDGTFVFANDDFDRTESFILLGSQGGSFYCTEHKLTVENADAVRRAIQIDGKRVVNMVVEISDKGKAPKNDPALFVLAMCLSFGDAITKNHAAMALPKVARIGTHLMHFAEYANGMRGWGRVMKRTFENWYTEKGNRNLAYDITKYVSRDGWSHRDILRLTKPKTQDPTLDAIYHYITKGWDSVGETPHPQEDLIPIWAAERAKAANSVGEIVSLIERYNIPMEVIPTELRNRAVYEAMIPTAGITWLLRNLGNLSRHGAIAKGQYSNLNIVVQRLTNPTLIKKGRVHPLSVLVALNTYKNGKGEKSDATWPVIQAVLDALDEAFYLGFEAVQPSGARFVLGCDVSPSMQTGRIAGMTGIVPAVATGVMAMASKRVETNSLTMAFTSSLVPVNLTKSMRLDAVLGEMSHASKHWGGTDCSLPMTWALQNKVEADAFVIYTDNDTNSGTHPTLALQRYRDKMGIDAKLIVVGMIPYGFTIADPKDSGMLDIHGFSTDVPAVISAFADRNRSANA